MTHTWTVPKTTFSSAPLECEGWRVMFMWGGYDRGGRRFSRGWYAVPPGVNVTQVEHATQNDMAVIDGQIYGPWPRPGGAQAYAEHVMDKA